MYMSTCKLLMSENKTLKLVHSLLITFLIPLKYRSDGGASTPATVLYHFDWVFSHVTCIVNIVKSVVAEFCSLY